ncbi:ATP-binding protein [Solimonas fluminis]|uniref:histidine kinase n=1 Tax=Solimonas fluminis TaxID=2086571 RepID=A0A2S5TBP2_9GAMM|nr:ATP-binding protein [Solimonas fluminis]PPE72424.1 ATP-binding protein [Solimonas fluminis]
MTKSIRGSLEEALQEESLDYARILSLAHDLSKEDSSRVRFSVDASHISRLGLELVSKQETAISELIKNAYDADAVTVDVVFKDSDEPGGILEIIDSGNGMSREQLLNGFMRISTTDKMSEPRSPGFGRQRAGRKGIGRFAAQRLGRRLHISTQQAGAGDSLEVEIDWDRFSAGVDLYSVSNEIRVCPAKASAGTTVKIFDLRDSWSEAQIRRAYRYVSDLLHPFPIERRKRLVDAGIQIPSSTDPGFKATFYKEQEGDIVSIASDEQDILGNAAAKLTAYVDGSGRVMYDLSSGRYKIDKKAVPLRFESKLRPKGSQTFDAYSRLSGVHLTAHYFIQEELPAGTRGMVREILNRTGGIRVYRNGFRVLPYGESFDDWLGLQRSSALRELLPPHSNTNFIGLVEVDDIDGTRFQETASREGLIENEAFLQLQDFSYRALMAAVIEIARARNRKVFASDEKPTKKPSGEQKGDGESVSEKAKNVATKLRYLAKNADSAAVVDPPSSSPAPEGLESPDEQSADTAQALKALADEVEEIGAASREALEEIGMLRVLASLGLTIGEFTHEVRHTLAALAIAIEGIGSGSSVNEALSKELTEHVLLLRGYLRYFDDAVTQNAHRRLEVHELRDIVNEFVEVLRPTLKRQNVSVEAKFNGYDLFTKPMHKSEWASTLLNLLTNSLKAIQRAGVEGRIFIAAGAVDGNLQIDFSDNGDGIPKENWGAVFDAFFTTSAPPGALASHSEQLVGTGLGLKIVKDIFDGVGGDIEVVSPPDGFSTCMRLTIPRATKDQIGDEQY